MRLLALHRLFSEQRLSIFSALSRKVTTTQLYLYASTCSISLRFRRRYQPLSPVLRRLLAYTTEKCYDFNCGRSKFWSPSRH
jgi:hypothetical protein